MRLGQLSNKPNDKTNILDENITRFVYIFYVRQDIRYDKISLDFGVVEDDDR